MASPVVAVEIGCRDKAKTEAFYAEAFGWRFSDYGSFARKFDTGAGSGVHGHVTALGHEPHDYVLFYVQVDDIAEGVDKVKMAGGSAHIGPVPLDDGRQFAWVKDPDGKLLGLITPAP